MERIRGGKGAFFSFSPFTNKPFHYRIRQFVPKSVQAVSYFLEDLLGGYYVGKIFGRAGI
ncbi:hypothetical protein [Dialister sp.]|uniref:hypothetical protein n=1 Tax=Dialister sp. TaxID=1955814 RepID=UPI0025E9BF1D|nr:hypothetical protein [Dialister sp.]MEE0292384.1 hypothetical protein [Dialister sp.]